MGVVVGRDARTDRADDAARKGKGKGKRPNPIPTAPGDPRHGTGGSGGGRIPGGSGGSGSGSGGGSRGGSSGGGVSGAEARAIARENDSKRKAANRYTEQAKNLEVQAKALRHALKIDFKHALRIKLRNVNNVLRDSQAILMEGYHDRVGSLAGSARDNEKAAAAQSGINERNLLRERNSAVTEAMSQGAGESDMLASQMMSLRNWDANQNEVQRSYFDTLRSVNASLRDLNVDTRTGLANNQIQANADKEQLWTNYYNQRSETFTNLGNVLGQQADYYAMAKEMDGKGDKGRAKRGAKDAFMNAALESGKAWRNPGVSRRIRRWDGRDDFEATLQAPSKLSEAQTTRLDKKPEGATLRKW